MTLLFAPAAAVAAPTCNPFTGVGITKRCPNINYDSTIPSGQTYARWFAAVWNPTGKNGSWTPCTVILEEGKGYNGITENFAEDVSTLANNLVANFGCAVYAFYNTWTVAMQVVSSHSIGDTSITVEPILNSGTAPWWPNRDGCVDGCAGINVPFTAIYGGNQADQETITCTAQSSTHNYTCAINPLVNNHGANEILYLPKTQYPAPLADLVAAHNFVGQVAGQGTYPGNPQNITEIAISSNSHLIAKLLQGPHNYCLSVGCGTDSWWGSTIGFNGGSSLSPTSWQVTRAFFVSVPWDANYEYNQATTGPNLVQGVLPTLLGCVQNSDANCNTFATSASPITLTTTQFPGPVLSTSGNADTTTPPCPAGRTWVANQPCSGNHYQVSGRPYLVFTIPPYPSGSAGHGSDCLTVTSNAGGCWPVLVDFLQGTSFGESSASPAP